MKSSTSKEPAAAGALAGKVAVVTGAGRGVGKAIATTFAHAGARSVFVVRDRSIGEQTVRELSSQGYHADYGVADITDAAQISMLALEVTQRYPVIDVLVNNAGIFLDDDRKLKPSNLDPKILEETLSVNLVGAIRMSNAFVASIPSGGRIINVSSTMGQLSGGSDGYGPCYSISKAALNMYTQLLAAALREREIMVDSFHPGWVKTNMGGAGATLEPEDGAKTALFLATRPASTQTGLFWHRQRVIDW